MQPKLSLLTDDLIQRILEEAFQLLLKPGIKVQNPEARELLDFGRGGDLTKKRWSLKSLQPLVHKALETVPRQFYLYDYEGNPGVQYGGDAVHFDPGSSGIAMLNPETLEHETTETSAPDSPA